MNLGDIVKDRITGFSGVAIARTTYRTNCDRFTVQSRELKDGARIDACTFDVTDLEVVEAGAIAPIAPGQLFVGLSDTVKDRVTGLEGIVTSITTWSNGCVRVSVAQTKLHDGKQMPCETIDAQELRVLIAANEPKKEKTGGPRKEPSR